MTDDQVSALDQAEEEALTFTPSDEALELAAGTEERLTITHYSLACCGTRP